MFTHKNCGGTVFPVQRIEIRCGMTLTYNGIVIAGVGKISKISPANTTTIVVCSHCGKTISTHEVESRCMQCGELHRLSDLVVLKNEQGIYCNHCKELFFPESVSISAEKAMEKTIG